MNVSLDHTAGVEFDVRQKQEKPKIELTFLGTRGEIEARSRRHRRHSALLVARGRARVMIDCGADWLRAVKSVAPTAIVLTHAHPDHAFGLKAGAPCPVYATGETWSLISRFPIDDRRIVKPRALVIIGGIRFEAFPVEHSLRAPAVGYRITADSTAFFYAPDLAAIPSRRKALGGIDFYIGDGATIVRSMVRRRDHVLIGHAPIISQLDWCKAEKVGRAIFTHCGSGIVKGNAQSVEARIKSLGAERNVEASVAYDGLKLTLDRRR